MWIPETRLVGWRPKRSWGHLLGSKERWFVILGRLDSRLVLRYVPWCGYLPVHLVVYRGEKTGEKAYPHWDVLEMKKRNQVPVTPEGTAQHLASVESVLFSKLHAIVKQLTVTRYDDGDPRTPGSLFISTQGSMWRATTTEPDACLKLTMMAPTLDDALAGLCLALEAESIPWEVDTYAMSKRPKPKK